MTACIRSTVKSVTYVVTVVTRKGAIYVSYRTAERFAMNTYPICAERRLGHPMFATDAIVFMSVKNHISFTEQMLQMMSICHFLRIQEQESFCHVSNFMN